jgi:signal transduction histidine kinase
VINLLTNALKAIESGGRVSISAYQQERTVCLEVADNGHGIEQREAPYIFERFYKVSGDGLGLGLAIVKELVAAHGGTIAVRSNSGAGTIFYLKFPQTTLPRNSGDPRH